MRILIISATHQEIFPLLKNLIFVNKANEYMSSFSFQKESIDVLITGIGLPYTIFHLTQALNEKKYDLVINAGIAGSFKDKYTLGTVVNVVEEQFSDLGVEDKDKFYTAFDQKLILPDSLPFVNGKLSNKSDIISQKEFKKIPKVKGITINTVSGNKKKIQMVIEKFNPDIETMENAGIFFVCLLKNIPFLCLRSISNRIEIRDKSKWNIPKSIECLNIQLIKILERL